MPTHFGEFIKTRGLGRHAKHSILVFWHKSVTRYMGSAPIRSKGKLTGRIVGLVFGGRRRRHIRVLTLELLLKLNFATSS